jgi:hypothetical protein
VVIAFRAIGREPVRSIATHRSAPTYAPLSADTRLKTTPELSFSLWAGDLRQDLSCPGTRLSLTGQPLHTRPEPVEGRVLLDFAPFDWCASRTAQG